MDSTQSKQDLSNAIVHADIFVMCIAIEAQNDVFVIQKLRLTNFRN